jgi:hypothetical protein
MPFHFSLYTRSLLFPPSPAKFYVLLPTFIVLYTPGVASPNEAGLPSPASQSATWTGHAFHEPYIVPTQQQNV